LTEYALQGRDIVLFTYADWHASWSTPQQVAVRLAPANRVLFVDVPRPFVYGFRKPDPQGAGAWSGPRVVEAGERLHVFHPPHVFLPYGRLPFPAMRSVLQTNGYLLAQSVRRLLHRLGMTNPILWNFSPLHGGAVARLPHALSVYEIADEWANYMPHRQGRKLLAWIDERLTRTADIVFAGTENSKNRRAGWNRELHVVHHAADYDHFARATHPDTAVPEDIAKLPHPIIGAIGVYDPARFDPDLIARLAEAFPSGAIVLVGPAREGVDLDRLATIRNVYCLGNRPWTRRSSPTSAMKRRGTFIR